MHEIFDAHFRVIQDAFGQQGIRIAVAYTEEGEVDYIYEPDRLLVTARDDVLARFNVLFPGTTIVASHPTFHKVSWSEDRDGGYVNVPDLLAQLDETFHANLEAGAFPAVSPNHLVHVERLCSAIEPEVPTGTKQPFPTPRTPADGEQAVRVGLVDSGLIKPTDAGAHPWLAGVDGDADPVGPLMPDGRRLIRAFAGHGTFVGGVVRGQAPRADVWVGSELATSGAELEDQIADKLETLIAEHAPAIVNISSGTYCRRDWAPLGFENFLASHPDVQVVAAAGNDKTDRPLYPAAFPEVISVGALGPDQTHRAWFSNYGPTVDVYALGEGHINAFTIGQYIYNEPPKRPARQDFTVPMARWDGTSFSAPMVTGLIAARMGQTGETSKQAAQAVLALLPTIPGVGPALLV